MDVVTYSHARNALKSVLDRVADDAAEVVVTRQSGGAVVMVSLESWNAIQETLYLLSTPNNASRLRGSIAELDAGTGEERDLVDP